MEISKHNRRRMTNAKGQLKWTMPQDGASVREIDRIRRAREESSKKRAKGRKRNRYKV